MIKCNHMKKEVVLAIITTIIGAMATYFVDYLFANTIFFKLGLYLLLLIIVIVVIFFRKPIALILTKTNKWKLSKIWNSKWSYEKGGKLILVEDVVKLSQRGSYISGRGESIKISEGFPLRQTNYRLKGAINQEGLITGTWENERSGNNYYGTFLLTISRDGKRMNGFWIGTANNGLNQGAWEWSLAEDISTE